MNTVVDFHVHVFPDRLQQWVGNVPLGPFSKILSMEKIQDLRRRARTWMKPIMGSIHELQTHLRYLPEIARKNLDELSALVPLPGFLLESTLIDLNDAMKEAGIQYAVLIAHPPFVSNEFILDICSENRHLIPAVNIPKGTSKPGQLLKKYAARGAKILKIHAAADGEGVDSPRYRSLLRSASDLGLPVIIHTGCIHTHVYFRDPSQGLAERFTPWYENYPQTQFILAHMNFHQPNIAIDLCEEFKNLWVDTSWQPAEVIGEAVRRLGAERVLFGTDWPLVGNNMTVGRQRMQDCKDIGLLNEEQTRLILGENAIKLLGLTVDAA